MPPKPPIRPVPVQITPNREPAPHVQRAVNPVQAKPRLATPATRQGAAHVQAALSACQAKQQPGAPVAARPAAPHVQRAVTATAQPRMERPAPVPNPVSPPKVVQKMKWETVKGTSTTYKTELMYGVYWRTYQAQTDAGNWIEIAKGESRYVEPPSSGSSSSSGLLMAPKDDALYNCHGFTFGGTSAGGGPYSILDGRAVTTLLADEYTEIENPVVGCTVVFGGDAHSGIVVGIDPGEAPLKKRVNVRSKLGTKNVISTETIEALDRFGKAKFYLRKTVGGSGGGSSSSSSSESGLPPVLPISVLGIEDLPPLIVAPRRGTVFEHPGNYAIERGLATAPSFNSEPISQGERNRMLLDLPYKARVL